MLIINSHYNTGTLKNNFNLFNDGKKEWNFVENVEVDTKQNVNTDSVETKKNCTKISFTQYRTLKLNMGYCFPIHL